MLAAWPRAAAAHGGSLHVVCARDRTRRPFRLTGLARPVGLAGTVGEALQRLAAPAGAGRRADAALTPTAGMAAISELCDRLDVTGALDAAVGPIKQRDRGFGAGELLAWIAAAQLAGEEF